MKKFLPLFLLFLSSVLGAQNTMYFMDRIPQSNAYNPAIIPELKFHIGLPVMNSVSAQVYNSGFNYGELDEFLDNLDRENYNPEDFVNSIGGKNKLQAELNTSLLSFGFKLKEKGYFAFDIKANSVILNDASPEVVYLLADYDDIAAGKFPLHIDEMDFITTNFISFGATYARVINDNLTIGIRPNVNFNYAGLKTQDINYLITRDEIHEQYEYDGIIYDETYTEYNETFSGQAKLGLPTEINPEATDGNELDMDEGLLADDFGEDISAGDFFKNGTFSLDMGATYQLEKWTFTASLLNLGSSKWRNHAYELSGVYEDDEDKVYYKEVDKVKIGIPTKIYLGAIRQFSPKWNYGLLLHNTFFETGSNASATISLNGYVGSMLSTSVSYTAGYKFNNVGLGLRMRFLPGADLFFVTDNAIQLINYNKAYRATAAFGINIAIGAKDNIAVYSGT